MRFSLEGFEASGRQQGSPATQLLLSRTFASEVKRVFFDVCEEVSEFDDSEKEVAKCLKTAVERELRWRNKFSHGDWWIGFGAKQDGSDGAVLGRPGIRGSMTTMEEVTPADIDGYSDRLYDLRKLTAEFGDICLGRWPIQHKVERKVRVRDLLSVEDGDVVRDGPLTQVVGLGTISYS
jgi:hypothetical protein